MIPTTRRRPAHRLGLALSMAATLLPLAACLADDEWRGFVYPDRHHLYRPVEVGVFVSFEACEEASLVFLSSLPAGREAGSYVCGRGCRFDDSMKLNLCEETRR